MGAGYSGISGAGNRIYTLMSSGRDENLVALDDRTGEEVWRLRTDDKRRDSFGDGPRSTPTLHGNKVFAVSALGRLWAVDRDTGRPVWDRDLRREFGATVPTWGVSASPVVYQDLLLFNVGGRSGHAVMAFNQDSGDVRWSAESGIPGYSLPLMVDLAGVEQSIFFTGRRLLSLASASGELLWHRPWKTAYDVNAAAPLFIPPDRVFVSSGYDTGASLLRVVEEKGRPAVEELWHVSSMKNQFSSSIYHEGHVYGFDDKQLKCIDVETGADRWRKAGFGHGSLIYIDEHLLVLSDDGRLALIAAEPDHYEEEAVVRIARGKHWTAPSYHRGHLLVRNQRELMSFQIESPASTPPAPPRRRPLVRDARPRGGAASLHP